MTKRDQIKAIIHEAAVAKQQRSQLSQKDRAIEPNMRNTARGAQKSFRIFWREFKKGFRTLRPLFDVRESLVVEAPTPSDIDPIVDAALLASSPEMQKAIIDGVTASIIIGGENLAKNLGIGLSFDIATDMSVLQYIATVGADRVVQINDTTKNQMRNILLHAVDNGWSWQRTAEEMEDRLGNWGIIGPPLRPSSRDLRTRAEVIAVTEIGEAYEAGTNATAQRLADAGLILEKRWITKGDNRVSDEDRKNAAQGWIPLANNFSSGDPHPLSHPGCRCTAVHRVVLP